MDPATSGVFIPIVALSIPIVAIIASTTSKRYKYLEDSQRFVIRLLEDGRGTGANS